jgi:hypothetical protein
MVMRMKLLVGLLMTVTFSTKVSAGTSQCSIIKDDDERHMCFALTTRNSTYCSFIKEPDKRAWCRALLSK